MRRPRWRGRRCQARVHHSRQLRRHHPHLQRHLHPERHHPRPVHPCSRSSRLAPLWYLHGRNWRNRLRIRIWAARICLWGVCTRIRLCQEVGGLSWPRSSGNGSSRGEIPLNSISLQTSGIPTFKFLLFKSTHLFSNLAIIFFLLKPFLMTCVFFLKNSPLKPLLLSITLLLATMLLLPVCAKILSKYLAALLLKRHQNLLLYSNWCQFSNNFPHLPISTFSLQIQSCWYRIRKKINI